MEQQKKNYQDKAHELLDDLFSKINSLEEDVKGKKEELSTEIQEKIQELKAESVNLKNKLNELADANADSWEEIRNGFEQAAGTLRESFSKAWDNLKKKD